MKMILPVFTLLLSMSALCDSSKSLFFQQLEVSKIRVAREYLIGKLDMTVKSIDEVTLHNQAKVGTWWENLDYYLSGYPEYTDYYRGKTDAGVTFTNSEGQNCKIELHIKGKVNSVERGTLDLDVARLSYSVCE